jgi:hypothetical protein
MMTIINKLFYKCSNHTLSNGEDMQNDQCENFVILVVYFVLGFMGNFVILPVILMLRYLIKHPELQIVETIENNKNDVNNENDDNIDIQIEIAQINTTQKQKNNENNKEVATSSQDIIFQAQQD